MKKILLPSIVSTLLALGIASAQTPRQQAPQQQQKDDSAGAQDVTLTGCLSKGASTGEYVLADKTSGNKVNFAASEKIEPYVNQTVELTGRVMDRGGEKVFQPQSVKRVAPSCEGGGEKQR
jgi:hypothetical protein